MYCNIAIRENIGGRGDRFHVAEGYDLPVPLRWMGQTRAESPLQQKGRELGGGSVTAQGLRVLGVSSSVFPSLGRQRDVRLLQVAGASRNGRAPRRNLCR